MGFNDKIHVLKECLQSLGPNLENIKFSLKDTIPTILSVDVRSAVKVSLLHL